SCVNMTVTEWKVVDVARFPNKTIRRAAGVEQFQYPRQYGTRARLDRAGAASEQNRAHAANGKLARKRQPRRAGADNNDINNHDRVALSLPDQLRRGDRRARAA